MCNMTIEQRLSNLENLVNALSKKIDRNNFYQSADTNGNRVGLSNTDVVVGKNSADIDYVAMMTDVELPN